MSFQRSTSGRHTKRESSNRHNSSGRPSPSSRDISSTTKQSSHYRSPPPSDSRLRLINERPPGCPRYYITSYQIQQYLLEDYDVPAACFSQLVEAIEKALYTAPCPVSFDIKMDRLSRLEARWCQDISIELRQILPPSTLGFLEAIFTKELGYFLFCLAQNCWDTMPDPYFYPITKKHYPDNSLESYSSTDEYVILNKDGTQSSRPYTSSRVNVAPQEPHITSSCGRSRAYFEMPTPFNCTPSPTSASPRTKRNNDNINREGTFDGKRRRKEKNQENLHSEITERRVWIMICTLIAMIIGYFLDSRSK
ncbi:hypothetical protein TWF192_005690 [Orbilia oligospora]|uniref:Uncharacterized protein n=1 Tax=Orbilia oligospora TaxID=2813651 RepID=A0A6G1MNZ7_ORBOL|nr:hypothetical protein TWF191_003949 [Orbilia oligospora]KAF3263409.1 hypothetical protein TWF192_005690 [Orbilia oligospora]